MDQHLHLRHPKTKHIRPAEIRIRNDAYTCYVDPKTKTIDVDEIDCPGRVAPAKLYTVAGWADWDGPSAKMSKRAGYLPGRSTSIKCKGRTSQSSV